MKKKNFRMKWFLLITVPVIIAGLLLLGVADGSSEKDDSLLKENTVSAVPVSNGISAGFAAYQEPTDLRASPNMDNCLLFKNILVYIP